MNWQPMSIHQLSYQQFVAVFADICLLGQSYVSLHLGLQAPMQQLVASQRPLVVVVEEAEAVDTLTLQDLILVLSEVASTPPELIVHGQRHL